MTSSDTKWREVWIEFGGDPSDDKEVYKRYSSTRPFTPSDFSDEVIHVIEIGAVRELESKLKSAREVLCDIIEHASTGEGAHSLAREWLKEHK